MSSPSPLTPSCLIPSKIRSYRFLSFPAQRSSLTRFLTRSFDALELYIQTQKALLARTQSDIDRLRLLREQAATDPEHFFDAFDEKVFFELPALFDTLYSQSTQQLNDNIFHFDNQHDIAAGVQEKIHWGLLKGQGTMPLSPSLS